MLAHSKPLKQRKLSLPIPNTLAPNTHTHTKANETKQQQQYIYRKTRREVKQIYYLCDTIYDDIGTILY